MQGYIYLEINEYYFFYGIKLYCVFVIMGQGLDNRLVSLGFLGIGVYGVEDVVKFSVYIGECKDILRLIWSLKVNYYFIILFCKILINRY